MIRPASANEEVQYYVTYCFVGGIGGIGGTLLDDQADNMIEGRPTVGQVTTVTLEA
jgi:hypothetical protein